MENFELLKTDTPSVFHENDTLKGNSSEKGPPGPENDL